MQTKPLKSKDRKSKGRKSLKRRDSRPRDIPIQTYTRQPLNLRTLSPTDDQ